MSAPINDGGPAFPHTHESWHTYPKGMAQPPSGMSLRDWFAGQALNGWLASWSIESSPEHFEPNHTAKCAYQYADAMLAAREVK